MVREPDGRTALSSQLGSPSWLCHVHAKDFSTVAEAAWSCAASAAAIAAYAWAATDFGLSTTMGRPASPPVTTSASRGMAPKNGTPSCRLIRSPPPRRKISVLWPQWGRVRVLMLVVALSLKKYEL